MYRSVRIDQYSVRGNKDFSLSNWDRPWTTVILTSGGTGYNAAAYYTNKNQLQAWWFGCTGLHGETGGYDAAGNTLCTGSQNADAKAFVWDAENRISELWSQQNNNTYNQAARYLYNSNGERARTDQYSNGNVQSWREYLHFNGNVIQERDQTYGWTDYIFANGKRVARIASSAPQLHVHGNDCAGCNAGWVDTFLSSPVIGYQIRSGDRLMLSQFQLNIKAGIQINTQEGGSTWSQVYDTDGNRLNDSGQAMGQWQSRFVDMSQFAGQHIGDVKLTIAEYPPANTVWDAYYRDIVIYSSSDGSVHPIYTAGMTPSMTPTGPMGQSDLSAAVDNSQGNPYFIVADQVGTATLDLNAGGWPVWKGEFQPFGIELDTLPTANRYKFTGKERDTESGLDYFGARYYANGIGRFFSPDWSASPVAIPYSSLNDPQSLNMYAYVRNNPLSRVDVDGHDEEPEWLQQVHNLAAGRGFVPDPAKPGNPKRTIYNTRLVSVSGDEKLAITPLVEHYMAGFGTDYTLATKHSIVLSPR